MFDYRKVVDEYITRMNAGDWEGVAALFDRDASVEDPIGSEPERGIEAIAAFYRRNTRNPMRIALAGPVRVAGREVAFPFSVSLNIDGAATKIDVIDIFSFTQEGKIGAMRAYFGPDNFSVMPKLATDKLF